jgi:hypothetical protein
MKTVAIDFGTSRTAFAYFDENGISINPESLDVRRWGAEHDRVGHIAQGLGALARDANVTGGSTLVGHCAESGIHWVSLFTRYCEVDLGPEALPFFLSEGRDSRVVPAGMKLRPGRGEERLKDALSDFGRVLDTVIRATAPPDFDSHQRVIGRSAGTQRSPCEVLGFGTPDSCYNEAVAVAWAMGYRAEGLPLERGCNVLVADLGGGFLDVALVEQLHRKPGSADDQPVVSGQVVTYGCYSLGVDRFDFPFCSDMIENAIAQQLYRLVPKAIAQHVHEWKGQSRDETLYLLLTGGGIHRLGKNARQEIARRTHEDCRDTGVNIELCGDDAHETKLLTLHGLELLHKDRFTIKKNRPRDLSKLNPQDTPYTATLLSGFDTLGATWDATLHAALAVNRGRQ